MDDPASQLGMLRQGETRGDSTQRGCTAWLLLSCVVLTLTTAFIFGWGLGAPNMYNSFTEPFLKGQDPCIVQSQALEESNTVEKIASGISTQQSANVVNTANLEETGKRVENQSAIIAEETVLSKPTKRFIFLVELIQGIPQTVFLVGAFLGALTTPFWVKLLDRKGTVYANYIFTFIGSLCMLLAYLINVPWLLYLSRLFLGYQGMLISIFIIIP